MADDDDCYECDDWFDDEDEFADYVPETKDPGKWLLIGTAILLAVIFLVPIWVAYVRAFSRYKKGKPLPPFALEDENVEDTDSESSSSSSDEEGVEEPTEEDLETTIPLKTSRSLRRSIRVGGFANIIPPEDENPLVLDDMDLKAGYEAFGMEGFDQGLNELVSDDIGEIATGFEELVDIATPQSAAVSGPQPEKVPVIKELPTQADATSVEQATKETETVADAVKPVLTIESPSKSKKERHPVKQRYRDYIKAMFVFDLETKKILKLVVPYSLASIVDGVFEILSLCVIGHFLGTRPLTAYVVCHYAVEISTMFLDGLLTTLTTVCSQAIGAAQYELGGSYVQMASILYTILYIPQMVLWWLYFDEFMYWFEFDDEVVQIGDAYMKVVLFEKLLHGYSEAFSNLLSVCDHERFIAVAQAIESTLNFGIFLTMVYFSNPSLQLIGIVSLAFEFAAFILQVIYVDYRNWLARYWKGMLYTFSLSNFSAFKYFCTTAIPISIGYVLAYGEYQVLGLFAGIMGPAELATWGVLGEIWEAMEELTEAWGDAAEVRCAHLLGANKPSRSQLSAYKSLAMGFFSSCICSLVILLGVNGLPKLITSDDTLQEMLRELLPFLALGNVALTVGTISWHLVGCQNRYKLATFFQAVGSWGVTLPLAFLATFKLEWNLKGLAACILVGYSVSGALNFLVLLMTKWEKRAIKVSKKTEGLWFIGEESAENLVRKLSTIAPSTTSHGTDYSNVVPPVATQPAQKQNFLSRLMKRGKAPSPSCSSSRMSKQSKHSDISTELAPKIILKDDTLKIPSIPPAPSCDTGTGLHVYDAYEVVRATSSFFGDRSFAAKIQSQASVQLKPEKRGSFFSKKVKSKKEKTKNNYVLNEGELFHSVE